MSSLIRKEALESKRQRLMGDVVLAQPLSFTVLALFLALIVLTISIFIASSSYARKETVTGHLFPDRGLVKVRAPRTGVVGQLHVEEGQFVHKGQTLLTLLGEVITEGGVEVGQVMLAEVDNQLAHLAVRESLEVRRRQAEQVRLEVELEGLEAEKSAIDEQLNVQRQIVATSRENYEQLQSIAEQGYISAIDHNTKYENLLGNRQLLAGLIQKSVAVGSLIKQLALAIERLPLESDERLSQMLTSKSDLQLRKIDFEGRRSITITAPVAGKVAAMQAIAGATVDPQLPMLSILPEGGQLEALLYVPTRAIGFVEVGQEVRLLYGAFDYRQFGVQAGTITDISSSIFSPWELQTSIQLSEPTYRVTVQIGSQAVEAYGRQFPLQSGMLLTADIIQKKRSLLTWILSPITSLRGRT
jgi:membrane fusion protein